MKKSLRPIEPAFVPMRAYRLPWKHRRGNVSQISEEFKPGGFNRRDRRLHAKEYIKDPVAFEKKYANKQSAARVYPKRKRLSLWDKVKKFFAKLF